MTDDDLQKILHRAAELQGLRTENPTPGLSDANQRQRLAFVAQAAGEIGISASDFGLATAEVTGSPGQKPVTAEVADRARRWLAHTDRVVRWEQALVYAPDRTLAALQAVLAEGDFRVDIANLVGEDPLVDGVLVLEPADLTQLATGNLTKFRYAMATADFRQVLVTVRPGPEGSVLTFHVNLDYSASVSHGWGVGSSATLALVAGLALGAVGGAGGPLVALAVGTATAVATYLGLKRGWQALYRWGLAKGRQALIDLGGRVDRLLRFPRTPGL